MKPEGPPQFNSEEISATPEKQKGEEAQTIQSLESLPLRKMYSLGDKIDLLLVYSGLKPATDITIGKDWEEGQRPLNLTEGEIDSVRRKLGSADLISVDLPKEIGTIEGIDEGETESSVKYHYEQSQFFVAKDKIKAEALRNAHESDDEAYGRLSGFPESAIKAYAEAKKNPTALIEIEDLPEEVRMQDFMAFATFKLSRENWREELETIKKWATTIKEIDPALYEEAVKTYREIMAPDKQEGEDRNVKRFFGHCFEILKFDEGDRIPVGGESIFSTEANIKVTGDFENFKQFLTETHELAGKYDLPKLKEWLSSQGIEIDEKLFATLFAFTKKFEEKYPDNPERAEARRKLYSEKGKEIKLSDIFNANTAECAEIAALAQGYLQQEGVPSTYFSGDVLWNKDEELSEEHSFVIIRQGDKVYIYDPTNPVNTTSGKFPSIYTTEANFDKEMAKGQKRFVTARNLLSKKEAFYGTNDGTNVWAEKHIV